MRTNLLILGIFFTFAFDCLSAVGVDIDFSVDKKKWIDPNDPLSYRDESVLTKPRNTLECDEHCDHLIRDIDILRHQYEALQKSRENSVDVLLKHILLRFVTNLNMDLSSTTDIYKSAVVSLSANNLRILREYLESKKVNEEFGLREHVKYALENFLIEADVRSESSLFSFIYTIMPYVAMLNVVIMPPALWILLRSVVNIRQMLVVVLIVAFFMSCYFTYAKKYQEVLAQRFERMEKKYGEACTPNGLMSEAYSVLLSYVRIKGKSECLQHYEDALIEPIWLVDPLQVVAEVISNFILTPLSVTGSHLNKFFSDFFIDTPLHLVLVKVIFLLLFLFYVTGYRLRTIFATLEPAESITRLIPSLSFRRARQDVAITNRVPSSAKTIKSQ